MVFLSDYFQFWKRIRKTFLWYLYFLFSFSWKYIDCYVFHIILCRLNFKFTFAYIGLHNLLLKTNLCQIFFKRNMGFNAFVILINSIYCCIQHNMYKEVETTMIHMILLRKFDSHVRESFGRKQERTACHIVSG